MFKYSKCKIRFKNKIKIKISIVRCNIFFIKDLCDRHLSGLVLVKIPEE